MKVWLAWSSGKDSAWTLHVLRRQGQVEVAGLLTTVNETHDRVAMHAVRVELLQADRRREPGGPAADDHHVVLHRFARAELFEDLLWAHGGCCRGCVARFILGVRASRDRVLS